MSTISTPNTAMSNLDEQDRQMKQAEMIRQYLQVANAELNVLPSANSSSTASIAPLSFNFQELRQDVKVAEQRVECLRQELKDLQTKRDDSFLRTPPPYISPSVHNQLSTSTNEQLSDRSSFLLSNRNLTDLLSVTSVDLSKDQRQRQFLLTMHQHREQLLLYLDSLKQALHSLDRLASLEPTQSDIRLVNMKLETIQQKSRQLRALKSTRSAHSSPFIECRIRQLERDLVYMLGEHQKDVQTRLDLNEQRTLMLLKIMQVTDELATLDKQILPTTDIQRVYTNQLNSSSPTFVLHNHVDGRRISFRESTDNHPLTKQSNAFHHHGI